MLTDLEKLGIFDPFDSGKVNIDFWHYMNPPEDSEQDEWEEIYSKMHKHREAD